MNLFKKWIHGLRDRKRRVRRQAERKQPMCDPSHAEKEALRKRNEKPPQAARRERALSICNSNTFEKEVSEQRDCHLFKLPLEIREMIYAELFTFERVWIMLVDKRLVCDWEHLPAKQNVDKNQAIEVSSSNNPSTEPASSYAPAKSSFGIHGPMHHLSHRKFRGTWVSFLQTCRRVYSEAIPFLYSLPTFFFHDTMPFLAFAASLPPSHFKHIRSVTINLACDFAQPLFPYSLWKRWGTAKHFHMQVTRPEATSLDYAFFHDGSFAGELLNASVLPPQNSNTLLPSYMWDAIASALEEMKGLKKVHITMRDIPRQILVWCEHGYEHSGQRDALEIRSSLEWIGRDRPWKGDKNEGTENRKGKETEVVFENVWRKNDEQKRGHWIRHVGDDGKVEWEEVGEAAGRVRRDF